MHSTLKYGIILAAVAAAIAAMAQGCGGSSDNSATVSVSLQEVH